MDTTAEVVRERMLAAKRLIEQAKYREARRILWTVDHPKAREWLTRIDQIVPERQFKLTPLRGVVIFVVVFLVALVLFGYVVPTLRFEADYAAARADCERWSRTALEASNCMLDWFDSRP